MRFLITAIFWFKYDKACGSGRPVGEVFRETQISSLADKANIFYFKIRIVR